MSRLRGVAILLALLFGLVAAPAQASFKSAMIEGMQTLQLPNDQVQLFSYSVDHPAEAAELVTRAVGQDYPLFALIGAAKAAKKGGLKQSECMLPVTLVTGTFDNANQFVSDQQAKADTNEATHAMAAYADEYRNQLSEEGKQRVLDEMSSSIPYYGDLPMICSFAFETNLNAEQDIYKTATHTVGVISDSYQKFAGGDYVGGVGTLIDGGLSEKFACSILVSGLEGGIGGAFGVTKLVGSMCDSVLGELFEFAKDVGGAIYSTAKDIGCAVWSLVSDGCSEAPPPPKDAINQAVAYCAPRGGVKLASSKSNALDDYILVCNDGTKCMSKPGSPPRCATMAEQIAEQRQWTAMQMAQLPEWRTKVLNDWSAKCVLECRLPMGLLVQSAYATAVKLHQGNPDLTYNEIMKQTFDPLIGFDGDFTQAIENQKYDTFPAKWAKTKLAAADKLCMDDQCRGAVGLHVAGAKALIKSGHSSNIYYAPVATPILAQADADIAGALLESRQRMAMKAGEQMAPGALQPNGPVDFTPGSSSAKPYVPLPDGAVVPATPTPLPGNGPGNFGVPLGAGPIPGEGVAPPSVLSQPTPGPLGVPTTPPLSEPAAPPIKVLPGMIATPPPAPDDPATSEPAASDESADDGTDPKKKGKKGRRRHGKMQEERG